ncbi:MULTISPECIES: hypothetical protein [Flavobacteriaceae]|jgi:hypothetical protein|uniref:Uncharacterized protein n=1 Tax=Arenibacter algicola TaxID=616991 RepID=A0A221V479_9FLAO|nr:MULTISPECIES: hypothetical protein [Flavobacteriaceae]ASO08373.1 hypothetical protein AREALGSMS7_04998 [Arenibacter algicola]USD27016.1 hypothetical protein MJO53_16690 [Allomuricauda aquimarina]|tara:strand:- start:48 stop:197 length:150 start_codon:yes stop_codon:yes gene_type:complete
MMVDVFVKGSTMEEPAASGEIVFDDVKAFKLHTSDILFEKDKFYYRTRL